MKQAFVWCCSVVLVPALSVCAGDSSSPAPDAGAASAWTVSAVPVASLHREAGPLCGAVLDSSGRILLCERRQGRIDVYNPDGTRVAQWDGSGDATGSFHSLHYLGPWAGDSVAALDQWGFAVTVFGPDGQVGRRFELPVPRVLRHGIKLHGAFPDGSFLFSYYPIANPFAWVSWEGARTDSAEYHLVDKQASRFLGRFPPGGDHKVQMSETEGVVETPPLANRRLTAVGDSQWYVAWSDTYDVAVYSPNGEEIGRIRRPDPSERVDPALADWLNRRFIDEAETEYFRDARIRIVDMVNDGGRLPAIWELLAGPGNELWIGELGQEEDGALEWSVFDDHGRLIGRVTTPPGLALLCVGEQHILAGTTDGSFVELYELRRGDG